MNTCKTCKHWGHSRNWWIDAGDRLKSCSAPKIGYGYKIDGAEITDDGALIEDDEGWGMLTGPAFGCVLHEAK